MDINWLKTKGNRKCILFFNGWGMDDNAIAKLSPSDHDICACSNYTSDFELEENFESYNSVSIIAWSLGVWVAAKTLSVKKITAKIEKSIAINGTLEPVHPKNGIHPQIFDATLERWNEENRDKFNLRMCGGRTQFLKQKYCLSARSVEKQKEELAMLKKEIDKCPAPYLAFDCAIVGKNDLIFTAGNQLNYWDSKTRVIEKDWPHFPFGDMETWNEIIDL